ncbi:MAG: DUF5060 domain-containing protein [Fimbriimonadaceae bacterium]|nr:DUF5060 domain-containing protein [Fimbriimonadaceae bacterium]
MAMWLAVWAMGTGTIRDGIQVDPQSVAPKVNVSKIRPNAPFYGPVTVSFDGEYDGNPYDPDQNDVLAVFTPAKGDPEVRIAYYDGERWKAHFATQTPGNYTVTLVRNGQKSPGRQQLISVLASQRIEPGFIRIRDGQFAHDDGKPYFPVGINVGWGGGATPPAATVVGTLAKSGLNWARVWACHWDGKNPWWPNGGTAPKDELWQDALNQWDEVFAASREGKIGMQMVLWHHGQYSSTVNPNWPEHPWNQKNGGFLAKATDFFTDAEAKRRSKMWLRHAVARYAHEPSLMAWELFNEVEWVDSRYANKLGEIDAWHGEMADYLRSIDPYGHLVTTSSMMEHAPLWEKMDYFQPHTYPANVRSAIGEATFAGKPGFFGEFGPPVHQPRLIRDGLFAGAFAGHAGAGQYWFWDIVEKEGLWKTLGACASFLDAAEIGAHPDRKRLAWTLETAERSDLSLSPGGGWQKSGITEIDARRPMGLSQWSSYIQGEAGGNAAWAGPMTIRFRSESAGTVTLDVSEVAASGATAVVKVNGAVAAERVWPKAEKNRAERVTLSAAYPAGDVTVEIRNPGADWFRLTEVRLSGLGAAVYGDAISAGNWLAGRVVALPGASAGVKVRMGGLPFGDGLVRAEAFDLETGARQSVALTVRAGFAELALPYADTGLVLRP